MNASIKRLLIWFSVVVVAVLLIQDVLISRENNQHINPQIFDAFDHIEKRVIAKYGKLNDLGKDPDLYMNNRELWVVYQFRINDEYMSAEQYYEELHERDYTLPSFYVDGYIEKLPWWKIWY